MMTGRDRNTGRSRGRRILSTALGAVAAIAIGAGAIVAAPPTERAEAAIASQFTPGNIISDALFYNADGMSAAQVQTFLNAQVPSCIAGYTCLKNYTETTASRAADAYCKGAYTGVANQSAAAIIAAVGRACGINPQVLLVLLQKEQGLVTSRSPSAGAYRAATGFGCPDTAPCDAAYYGFSNQVWRAARQFQIYRVLPNNFNHKAGRVNAVRFHPNAACGTSAVYIENQATAGLYNYTPYQPNGPAMNNLYGTGDGCSSYGNRNFWRIFTDWFGSPNGFGTLLRTANDPTIYLATNTEKYPVRTSELFNLLQALGPYYITTQQYMDTLTTRYDATNLLRNQDDGFIYLAGGGQKNKFPSCELIVDYGFSGDCGTYVNVTQGQLYKFATGPDVTPFALSSTGIIYHVDDGKKRALHAMSQLDEIAAGGSTAYTPIAQATLDLIPTGPDVLIPGSVLSTPGSTTSYVSNGGTTVIKVDSPNVYAELGLGKAKPDSILPAGLAAMTVAPSALSLNLLCGSTEYMGGGGSVWKLPARSGLPTTSLTTDACATLTAGATSVSGSIFLLSPTGLVYHVTAGKKRLMATMAQVGAINGSAPLSLIPATTATLDAISSAPDLLAPATLVRSANVTTVFLVDGDRKIRVDAMSTVAEFGLTAVKTVSVESLDAYPTATAPLGFAVTCGVDTYLAGGGKLWKVPTAGGLPTTALDSTTCAALPKSATTVTGAVFLIAPNGYVYSVSGGQKKFMKTMAEVNALNGSKPLVFIPLSAAALDSIPSAPEVLPVTSLVKSASSPSIAFVDGTNSRIPIESFDVAAEFGVTTYSTASDATLANYPATTATLTTAVTCGSATYIAGGGKLYPSTTTGGLRTTPLATATCAAVPKATTSISGALFVLAPNGFVYHVIGGKKQFMSSMAQVNQINGTAPLVLVPAKQGTLDLIPTVPEVVPAASLVKTPNVNTVYFVNGTTNKIPITSFAVAAQYGVTSYSTVSDATAASYPTSGTSLSIAATCGGTPFIAGSGRLYAVPNTGGLPVSSLDSATCAALPRASETVTGAVFLLHPNGNVYTLSNGTKQFVTSMAKVYQLNGSNPLVFIPSDATVLAALPTGPNI